MATQMMDILKVIIFVQLFYSFSITVVAYSLPSDQIHHVDIFSGVTDQVNIQDTALELQNNIQSQASIPLIDIGALVFFSGNIILDMLLNFLTALPQMFVMLINGFEILFHIPTMIKIQLQILLTTVVMAMFVIMVLQLLTNIRSGRVA